MQIETTMGYDLTPVRMATISKSRNRQVLRRMWTNGNTFALLVGAWIVAATIESSMVT